MIRTSVMRRLAMMAVMVCGAAMSVGCVSTSASSSGPPPSRNILTAEDLREVPTSNLYRAIEQLRPLWLTSRSSRSVNVPTEIAVIIDGTYFGPVDSLRQMTSDNVREIRYLGSSEATAIIPGISRSTHIEAAIWLQYGDGA